MDPVDDYLTLLAGTLARISRQQVWSVISILHQAWRDERRIFLIGNGGSAATASHMANDLNKFTIVPGKRRFRAIALTDNIPLITAWANDQSYDDIFTEQLKNLLEPGDVIIAISTSGNSPNIVKAMQLARGLKAVTIAFTGDIGGRLKELADYCVYIPDPYIGRQEDGHMILDHMISNILRQVVSGEIDLDSYNGG